MMKILELFSGMSTSGEWTAWVRMLTAVPEFMLHPVEKQNIPKEAYSAKAHCLLPSNHSSQFNDPILSEHENESIGIGI